MKERFISLSILAALVLVTAPAHAAEADTATDVVSFRESIRTELKACRSLTDVAVKFDCRKALRVKLQDWRQSNNTTIQPRPLRRPVVTSYVNQLPEDLQKRIEACRAETDLAAKKDCRKKIYEAIKEYKKLNVPGSWPASLKEDIQVCRRDNRPDRIALITCIEEAFTAAGIDMPTEGPWTNIGHGRQRARFVHNLSEDRRAHLRDCREKSNGDLKVFRECTTSVLSNSNVANTRLPHRFTKYNDSLVVPSTDDSSAAPVPTNLLPFSVKSVKPGKSLIDSSIKPTW